MAAASMAQAHRAVLREGQQPVVLKVLRPGIERVINADIEILKAVAEWMSRHSVNLPLDPVAVDVAYGVRIIRACRLGHVSPGLSGAAHVQGCRERGRPT